MFYHLFAATLFLCFLVALEAKGSGRCEWSSKAVISVDQAYMADQIYASEEGWLFVCVYVYISHCCSVLSRLFARCYA